MFLHISAFSNRNRRPETGQFVNYELTTDDRGRTRATQATLPGDRLPIYKKKSRAAGAVIFTGVFFGVVALSVIFGKVPALILWGYLAISLLTFLVYAFDKTAARDGVWRTQESTLHLLSLAGGWPGALIAQQKLRHKSRKERFRMVYWMTVMMNVIAFAWLFTSTRAGTLQSWIG